jgi:hypothetical protein
MWRHSGQTTWGRTSFGKTPTVGDWSRASIRHRESGSAGRRRIAPVPTPRIRHVSCNCRASGSTGEKRSPFCTTAIDVVRSAVRLAGSCSTRAKATGISSSSARAPSTRRSVMRTQRLEPSLFCKLRHDFASRRARCLLRDKGSSRALIRVHANKRKSPHRVNLLVSPRAGTVEILGIVVAARDGHNRKPFCRRSTQTNAEILRLRSG